MPASERRRRVVIVSGASLAWNPRVLKEATALARADFEVIVLGRGSDTRTKDHDREIARRAGFVFQSTGQKGEEGLVESLLATGQGLRNALGVRLHRATGIESRFQLGPLVDELLRSARTLQAALYIVHLEQALWVGARLMEAGHRVGIDVEDWYSEDLLPEARKSRPLRTLRQLEEVLLRGAVHRTCPSRAMGNALSAEFGCPPPTVLYNAFAWSDRSALDGRIKDRPNRRVPSIHWYSQTLGPGRGLEDLFAAMPLLSRPVELHLRGQAVNGFEQWMSTRLAPQYCQRVFTHDVVPHDELLSRIAEHDIGFAGEMKFCRSRDLTATNKILHYLLGGLAVVASDTAGQTEVAEQARGAIRLFSAGLPPSLAAQLNHLLESAEGLASAKHAALEAARMTFCWERQEPLLLRSVEAALT